MPRCYLGGKLHQYGLAHRYVGVEVYYLRTTHCLYMIFFNINDVLEEKVRKDAYKRKCDYYCGL